MTVASLFTEIGVDTSPMAGVARDVQNKLQPLQKTFKQVGASLTKYVTVPLVGAAAAATKTGIAIDDNFAKIEGLVGESRTALQGMRDDVLNIGTATGKGPEELSEALFFVESAGFRGAEAVDVLRASAKAAAAGLGETKRVADAVTSAVNAYGGSNLSAARATDVLTATVREGKVEASELAGSLGKVIPLASEMGVEFNEVGATLASLTRIGANSRRATTALSATLRTLAKGTPKTREVLQSMGLTLEGVQQKIEKDGLLPTLQLLQQRFEETGTSITDVFPNARALKGVLGLIGQNAEQAEEVFARMNSEVGGATQTAFEAAENTISNKFNRALRQLQAILDETYRTFKNQIKTVLDATLGVLASVRQAWASMSDTMQGVVVAGAAVAAALGPILLALGGILALVPTITAALASIGAAVPYVAAIGAVATMVYQNWDQLATFFTSGPGAEMWDALTRAAQAAGDAVKRIVGSLKRAAYELYGVFKDVIQGGGGIIGLIGRSLVEAFEGAANLAIPVMEQIADAVDFLAGTVARSISFIVDVLTGDFAGAWETVKDQVREAKNFIMQSLANLADAVITMVETTVNMIPGINVEMDKAREAVREWGDEVQDQNERARKEWSATMKEQERVFNEFEATMGEDKTVTLSVDTSSVEPNLEMIFDLLDETRQKATQAGEQVKTIPKPLKDARDAVAEMKNEMDMLLTPQGVALAQAKRTKEQLQAQIEAVESINRILARRQAGTEATEVTSADTTTASGQLEEGASILDRVPTQIDSIKQKVSGFGEMVNTVVNQTDKTVDRMVGHISQGFGDLITKGKIFGKKIKNVEDAFQSLGNMVGKIIKQMISQLIAAIAKALLFKALTGGGGSVFSLAGSFLGGGGPSIAGKRAEGGTVSGGRSYVVGEKEPEIFTPRRRGTVTPMSKMQGSRKSNTAIVKLGEPRTLPNGDIQFSLKEGGRQQARRGFPDD